jgi:hypothetical protein
MAELQLTLSDEEHAFLVEYLERKLKEVLVEEHRTRTLSYREFVQHEEDLIKQVLDKLKRVGT